MPPSKRYVQTNLETTIKGGEKMASRRQAWEGRAALLLVTGIIGMTPLMWSTASASSAVTLPMAPAKSKISSGQEFFKGATYAGSESCKSCHEKAYASWKDSWHSKANRLVTPEIMVADFENVELKFTKPKKLMDAKGKTVKEKVTVTMRLHKEGDSFLFTIMDTENPANNQTHEVALVRGGNWEQHYYAKVGDNLFPTPMRWVVADKAWRKKGYNPGYWWVYKDGQAIPRTPEEFSDINYRSVEVKCAGCHQVGFEPAYDKDNGLWNGTRAEYGVGCEHCHGPGSLHNQEAKKAEENGVKLTETTIINPETDLTSLQQIQICATCHIRGNNSASLKKSGAKKSFGFQLGFLPGDQDLHDRFVPWTYFGEGKTKSFWPNNQNRKNRQQYLDFVQSKHFTEGITCNTCHSTMKTKADRDLRMAKEDICNSCHNENGTAKRPNKEMFTGSTMHMAGVLCVDCHMPLVVYGSAGTDKMKQHWDRRSHTFKSINPEYKDRWAMRVACDQCHVEPKKGEAARIIKTYAIQSNEKSNQLLTGHQQAIREKINTAQEAIAVAEKSIKGNKGSDTAAVQDKLARARQNVSFVVLDGSWGFHNFTKASALLDEAIVIATAVKSSK
jgi:predicted CXXCH cytochrome family protein